MKMTQPDMVLSAEDDANDARPADGSASGRSVQYDFGSDLNRRPGGRW